MKVYVCEGTCGGVSPVAKGCGDPNCTKHGEPLTEKERCEKCGKTYAVGSKHSCA